jgi:hypothetical protein
MTCKTCNAQTTCSTCATPQTISVCQPIPFPYEPELVTPPCLDSCTTTVPLADWASSVGDALCKLNPNAIEPCTIPVGVGNSVEWKSIGEAIGGCLPGEAGKVLTANGAGDVLWTDPVSCSAVKNILDSNCLSSYPTPPTRVLGDGASGVAFYKPPTLTCVDVLDKLSACPQAISTPATQVLGFLNGVPVKQPLPQIGCNDIVGLFGCVPSSSTPASTVLTVETDGSLVTKPLPIAQPFGCSEFKAAFGVCVPSSSTTTDTAVTIVGGQPTLRPVRRLDIAELTAIANNAPLGTSCEKPDFVYGGDASSQFKMFVPKQRYSLKVGLVGTAAGQVMTTFNTLHTQTFPTLIHEVGLCGSNPAWDNTTSRFTAPFDGLYFLQSNRYVRHRITFTGTPVLPAAVTAYYGLTIVHNAAGSVEGIPVVSGAEIIRSQEVSIPADNQTHNRSYSVSGVYPLLAGDQVLLRYVVSASPTATAVITQLEALPTGTNSGADSWFTAYSV